MHILLNRKGFLHFSSFEESIEDCSDSCNLCWCVNDWPFSDLGGGGVIFCDSIEDFEDWNMFWHYSFIIGKIVNVQNPICRCGTLNWVVRI